MVNWKKKTRTANQAGRKTANSSSTSQYPPYVPVGNNDTWLSYYDAETNFSCQYPTNWRKITGAKGLTPSAEPPLLRLVNGANQLIGYRSDLRYTKKSLNISRSYRSLSREMHKENQRKTISRAMSTSTGYP